MVLLALETWPFFCCWQNCGFYSARRRLTAVPQGHIEPAASFHCAWSKGTFFSLCEKLPLFNLLPE